MTVCAIGDCDSPRRKRGWCDRHYQAWRKHGDPLGSKYQWSARTEACVACGKAEIAPKMRKFCSVACRQSEYRKRQRKTTAATNCTLCGTPLLTGRIDGRSVHKETRRYCADCRSKPRRSYRLAVHILAHYQGTDCGICGEAIDMSLRFPDKRSASIDHIQPLALGGTDDVLNLQLAHYDCNCRREGYFALISEETE